MELTDRERRVFKRLFDDGRLEDVELINAGYLTKEINAIKSGREPYILYHNVDNVKLTENTDDAVSIVLGSQWKQEYDYTENRRNGKYYLSISLTKAEYDKICKVARGDL